MRRNWKAALEAEIEFWDEHKEDDRPSWTFDISYGICEESQDNCHGCPIEGRCPEFGEMTAKGIGKALRAVYKKRYGKPYVKGGERG